MTSIEEKFNRVSESLGQDNALAEKLLIELRAELQSDKDARLLAKHAIMSGWLCHYKGDFEGLANYYEQYDSLLDLAKSERSDLSNGIINFLGLVLQAKFGISRYRAFLKESIGDLDLTSRSAIAILGNLGQVYEEEGNVSEATRYYEQAVELSENFPPSVERANALLGYAQVISNVQQSRALSFAEIALRELNDLGHTRRIAIAESTLSIMNLYMRRYKQGLQYLHASLEYFVANGDLLTVGHLLMNSAQFLFALGDIYNGHRVIKIAQDFADGTNNARLRGRVLLVTGECLYDEGLIERAEVIFREAFRFTTEGEYANAGLAMYIGARAVTTMHETGNTAELKQCVGVLEDVFDPDLSNVTRAMLQLAIAHKQFYDQDYTGVIATLQGVPELLELGRYPQMSVDAFLLSSRANLLYGDTNKAFEDAMDAYRLSKRFPEHVVAVKAAKRLADVVLSQGDQAKAISFYKEALRNTGKQRSSVPKNVLNCFDEISALVNLISQAAGLVSEN